MGRCPVRSIFPQALEMLEKKQHLLGFMSKKIMPLSEAVEGYDLFDSMKVQKGMFCSCMVGLKQNTNFYSCV
jgi:threonine dehydrogenase-like Zn-dependent dehydrogenase